MISHLRQWKNVNSFFSFSIVEILNNLLGKRDVQAKDISLVNQVIKC